MTWRAALAGAAGLLAMVQAGASSELDVAIGRALFKRAWVPAPSSTLANDGLGPLYNARACISCHQGLERPRLRLRADGSVESEALVLRFSDREGGPAGQRAAERDGDVLAVHGQVEHDVAVVGDDRQAA